MSEQSATLPNLISRWGLKPGRTSKIALGYILVLLIPYVLAQALPMAEPRVTYVAVVTFINIVAMMAFFVQFPLGSRMKRISLFANIDWNMSKHKRVGQWLGVIFLLHPALILFPRFIWVDGWNSVVTVLTAPQMLTGIIAWVLMLTWILASIFKNKLPLSYEMWRLTHMLGFVVIAILATLHITTVGSHGQFQPAFNQLWWALCSISVAMVLFNYLMKPLLLHRKPFTLNSIKKVSSTDWEVTLEAPESANFSFEPGQFIWFNTSRFAGNLQDHPFSIASCKQDLPEVSFIIRELGDYTQQLTTLEVGQKVYVDGPYGSMSLDDTRNAKGITLIGGGSGIGPMVSLLKGLAAEQDPRPIRLLYGANRADQFVLQEELKALETSMPNFQLQLVCLEATDESEMYKGVVDQSIIERHMYTAQKDEWAVYLCGPEAMIKAVRKQLKAVGIHNTNVHFEQLAF